MALTDTDRDDILRALLHRVAFHSEADRAELLARFDTKPSKKEKAEAAAEADAEPTAPAAKG